MEQEFNLTKEDIKNFLKSKQEGEIIGGALVGNCLGANTLNWKYPSFKFGVFGLNSRFFLVNSTGGYTEGTDVNIDPEVREVLLEFDYSVTWYGKRNITKKEYLDRLEEIEKERANAITNATS